MNVDVIIATNRCTSDLIPILESIRNQNYKKFSLIIVMEGETRLLMDICKKLKMDNVKILSIHKGTSNAALARNLAIRESSSEIILFTDDDMVLASNYIEEHVEAHKTTPNAVVRGLRYQKKEGGGFYIPHWEQLAMKRWNLKEKKTAWIYFVTSNASVSRTLLRKAGEFDEHFIWSGCEDTDLAYRLINAGGKPLVNDKAINFHMSIDDMQKKFEKRIDNFHYFQEKYPYDPRVRWFVKLTLHAIDHHTINHLFLDGGSL